MTGGNLTGLAAQPLTIALSFLFFERLKIYADDGIDMLPNAVSVTLAGGVSSCLAVIIAYPLRSAKDKLQGMTDGQYTGMVDVPTPGNKDINQTLQFAPVFGTYDRIV